MFCPLCKYEYRRGFTECSDCHLPLVATKEEAEREPVAMAWQGTNKTKLEHVLDGLQKAEIRYHFKESMEFHPRLEILGFTVLGKKKSLVDNHYEVTVLMRDLQSARRAMAGHPLTET